MNTATAALLAKFAARKRALVERVRGCRYPFKLYKLTRGATARHFWLARAGVNPCAGAHAERATRRHAA